MRLDARDRSELTYCTNVYAGESWPAVRGHLEEAVPAVKRALGREAALGVGLRLSAEAAAALGETAEREVMRDVLDRHGLYALTVNGFPYGAFHGVRVKERVFEPGWGEDARLDYTNRLAWLLAALLPPGVDGTISTVPGGVRGGPRRAPVEEMARRLLLHAAELDRIRETTGRTIRLALEPEPFAYLESTAEAIGFFEQHLLARDALRALAVALRRMPREAEEVVRRHLGLCLDACHMAVAWEEPAAAVRRIVGAGICIAKVQVSAALEVDGSAPEALRELGRFADDVYLHQVFEQQDGRRRRFRDLADALEGGGRGTWRIHFHVPVFRSELGPFRSTQASLRELLAVCRRELDDVCYEVETYTWGVLPEEHVTGPLPDLIAREILWAEQWLQR
jgi:hypothetical protein